MFAKMYVLQLKENVKRSINHKIGKGELVYKAPIGYKNIKDPITHKATVIVDSEKAPLIQTLFNEYATGLYSIGDITKLAKKIGLQARLSNSALAKSYIFTILNNPFYYGLFKFKDQLIEHHYERIISKGLFDKCQEVRHGFQSKRISYSAQPYIFRGLVKCAVTGKLVSCDIKKGKYVYLISYNPENPIKKIWVKEKIVLDQIRAILQKIQISSDTLLEIKNYLHETSAVEEMHYKKCLTTLTKENTELENKVNGLVDLLLRKIIDENTYHKKNAEFKQRRLAIQEEIRAYQIADDGFKKGILYVMTLLARSYPLFESSTNDKKRKFINLVFSNLELRGTTLCYTIKKPFDLFVVEDNRSGWRALVDKIRTDRELRSTVIAFYIQRNHPNFRF
jgi:hypothetical protein